MNDLAVAVQNVHLSFPLLRYEPGGVKEAFLATVMRRLKPKHERVFWALKDISFQVKKGEVLGVIGRNGSGKSTLVRVISKIYAPDKGAVQTYGSLATLQLGSGFREELTGEENIRLSAAIMGMSNAELSGKLKGIVEFSGLGDFIHQPFRTYSSGMRARLGFSVASSIEPDILLLDEVLAVGDMEFRERSMARIEELVAGNATVIIVSHNVVELERLCTRVLWLYQGCVQAEGTPSEIIRRYNGK